MVASASSQPEKGASEASTDVKQTAKADEGDTPESNKQPDVSGIKLLINWVRSVLSAGKACSEAFHCQVLPPRRSMRFTTAASRALGRKPHWLPIDPTGNRQQGC